MSVANQIESDWNLAIKKAMKPRFIDRGEQIQIVFDSSGNEYFFKPETEDETTFRVHRPDGINCTVYKKGFKKRWVNKNYVLPKIKW